MRAPSSSCPFVPQSLMRVVGNSFHLSTTPAVFGDLSAAQANPSRWLKHANSLAFELYALQTTWGCGAEHRLRL